MSLWKRYVVFALTLLSLFPLVIIRVNEIDATFFWMYSILTTLFLLFMYYFTYKYIPLTDINHRPMVTVVVPCKNEEAAIAQTITGIIESDYPTDKLKVIVIDDGSTDQTYQIAKQYESDRLKVIKLTHNMGKRQAFAKGFYASDGEIVICIDSDTIVAKDAIRLLVQPFIDDKVVAVCGHGEAANKEQNLLTKVQHYWYQQMFTLLKRMESKLNVVTCCSGILAAYRRDVVAIVIDEWLNENFMGNSIFIGDDRQLTNLSARGISTIKAKEAKVVYQSNAIAYTIVPDNFKQFVKQQLRWKRAWIHGSKLAGQFMWRKKLPAPLYFYIYQALTFSSPVIIFTWIVLMPLSGHITSSIIFLLSVLYIAFLHGLNTWCLSNTSKSKAIDYIFYTMLFVPISILMSLTVLPYAWSTFWKGGWVTRSEEVVSHVEDNINI